MNDTFDTSKLLKTLSEQDASKRHADDQDTYKAKPLPVACNPEIIAWLRSLAPLTEQELYNNSWKD